MSYKALVLFDIDGTLTRRAGPYHRDALAAGIRNVTGLETTTEGIPVQGMLDPVILATMMRRAGAKAAQIRAALPDVMRAAEPNLRVGWSVPRVKRDYTSHALTLAPALVVLAAVRLALPARAAAAVRGGRIDAVMAHWRLVTPRLAYAVGDAGGQLYVWTVDDPALVPRLVDLGVAGIISNDPRILAAVN